MKSRTGKYIGKHFTQESGLDSHISIKKKIIIKMALSHKQPVYTELLKGHHIIFPGLVIESLQFRLQVFPGLFHLLNGIVCSFLVSSLLNRHRNLINLFFNGHCLPFS